MSDSIAPFVSSSPPPFDADNFKFEDEEDLFETGNVDESYIENLQSGITEVPEYSGQLETNENMAGTSEDEEEFEEFLDYQATIIDSDKVDLTVTSENVVDPQISNEKSTTNTNQVDCGNIGDVEIVNDGFDDFEEFVAHDNSEMMNSFETKMEANKDMESTTTINSTWICNETQLNSDDEHEPSCESFSPDFELNNKILFSDVEKTENLDAFHNQEVQRKSLGEDSWACFESFTEHTSSNKQATLSDANKSRLDDVYGDDDDDDFGGFEEAIDLPAHTMHSCDITKILSETFCTQSRIDDNHVTCLLDLIGGNSGICSEDTRKYSHIWKNLESIEMTPALKLHWKKSALFQSFLKTINVSQRTMKSSHLSNVPVFATNLGLLEPTKLHDIESMDIRDDGNVPTNDVPNVEFDWADSVLMDPLDTCMKEKELLESLEPSYTDPHKSLSVDSFMASMASNNVTLIKNPADFSVSPQLKIVLDQIPDLSFMQAKVLMFPVREEFIGTAETCS